jgi:oleandomycin transport system ATP-binding protein
MTMTTQAGPAPRPELRGDDHAVVAEGLAKTLGTTRALDGIDLVVPRGTVLGLLGPNGAGKTTAVRILSTLITPDAGRATVGGFDVVRQPDAVRRVIGLTGQYATVDEELSGIENLMLVGRLLELPRATVRARGYELLEQFSLTAAAKRVAKTSSGGMRRRLDLAVSLIGDPDVLFLDEPTTGLDPRARQEVWQVVRERVASGVSVLLTTQYLDEAEQLAGEIVVLDKGRVIASGTPDDLKSRVGGQTLTVRPTDERRLPQVVDILRDVTHSEPQLLTASPSAIAPVDDEAMLPAVVARLAAADVAVLELQLGRPSLDEVFLTITGHRAAESDDVADDAVEDADDQPNAYDEKGRP